MANGLPLDPEEPISEAVEIPTASVAVNLIERAAEGPLNLEAARFLRSRQPLRPKKQRLPLGVAVNENQVRNTGDLMPPGPSAPAAPLPSSPPPATAFDGGVDDSSSIPPDTMGVVNRNVVFNPLNNNIQIQDRGGAILFHMTLDRFWDVFPTPMDAFDPRAAYDPFDRRFLFTSTANAALPTSSLLIGVSQSDDPAGSWTLGFLRVDPGEQGEVWLDYPSIGFCADKITVQVNMYTLVGNNFAGSSIYVWDKNTFYHSPTAPPARLFVLRNQGGTQVPALTYDPDFPIQYLVSRWTGDSEGSGLYLVHEITGSVSLGTVALRRVGFIRTAPGTSWDSFVTGDFAPQQGTTRKIDAGDDRILSVVYRNQSLWFSHTVFLPAGGPARSAAQWLQVETGAWSIRQMGRVEDPAGSEFFAFPTLAVNAVDDVLMGFSCFSKTRFASGAYALRRAGDPSGLMRSPQIYAPGGSTYFKTFGGTDNRWGDYSSTQVDPLDDRSFWTIQEYASPSVDTWATKWARVT